ncbi:DeoR/GlpR family DNA-binding transcription regulator [Micromonospora sp. WMMD1076]|uniref:DeoR/GlpR family DNA-binding transcription regulator n=1 Tax=Micromonospora TaxID=1873 RepID=UPI00249B9FF9|nr:DeoR/GlpR family DNA-binding transcription regulator [Micromonospora sp. WMMD1076]WFF04696.1 DeoR/GlpR family DNA-binding transcription regulator [Micromonospora sp. WMMD1076]
MGTADRRQQILAVARDNGSVDVHELATEFTVAQETIRRDLTWLEQQGLVRRTHGGAYPVETARFETTLAARTTRMIPEKRRIAGAAARLLGDAETIYVDEGYTPQLIAETLPTDRALTVVTASLPTAAMLAANPAVTVLLLGGRVRGQTQATVDHWATTMLAGFVIDLAFLGANGISRQHGLTTPDPAVGAVKAKAVAVSRRVVFSGIHTKFGVSSFFRFAGVKDVHTIVTDAALPASEAHRYSLLGPVVHRV